MVFRPRPYSAESMCSSAVKYDTRGCLNSPSVATFSGFQSEVDFCAPGER